MESLFSLVTQSGPKQQGNTVRSRGSSFRPMWARNHRYRHSLPISNNVRVSSFHMERLVRSLTLRYILVSSTIHALNPRYYRKRGFVDRKERTYNPAVSDTLWKRHKSLLKTPSQQDLFWGLVVLLWQRVQQRIVMPRTPDDGAICFQDNTALLAPLDNVVTRQPWM